MVTKPVRSAVAAEIVAPVGSENALSGVEKLSTREVTVAALLVDRFSFCDNLLG